jgi:hypothetical protein
MSRACSYVVVAALFCIGVLACDSTSTSSDVETSTSLPTTVPDAGTVSHPPQIEERAPTATPFSVDFYGFMVSGQWNPGDVVTAYDPDGVLCGKTTVNEPGQYGFLHVYGDDPTTQVDEGATDGDAIVFEVNGQAVQAAGPDEAKWSADGDRWHVDLSEIDTPQS